MISRPTRESLTAETTELDGNLSYEQALTVEMVTAARQARLRESSLTVLFATSAAAPKIACSQAN